MAIFNFTDVELTQIRNGDIDGFKNTLIANNCTHLALDAHLQNETRAFFVNLGKALQELPGVVSLHLEGVKMAKHAPYFATALKGSNLESLTVKRGQIGKYASTFAHNLIGSKLKKLNLEQNYIEQHAIHLMAEIAKTEIESLDLNCNGIVNDAIAVASAVHGTKLKFLGLGSNGIANHAPAVVTALQGSDLKSLDLSSNQLHDVPTLIGLAGAFNGTEIKKLSLRSNSMSQSAAPFVKLLKGKVETLDLSYNHIGNYAGGLGESLKGKPIRSLNLECNDITGEAANAFAKAIHGSLLKSINLSVNQFSDNPSFVKELPATVTSLKVTTTNSGAPALAKALEGTTIREIKADASIGFLSASKENLIKNAVLANRRQNLRVDSLVAGYELAELSKKAGVPLPKDIRMMIARRIPNQSNNPLALARFMSGFDAVVNPSANDSIKSIENLRLNLFVDNLRAGNSVANSFQNANNIFPVNYVVPLLQPLPPYESVISKARRKISDFANTPSKYPVLLGLTSSIFLMSALSLAVTLSVFTAITGAFVLTGAIIAGTKWRNKLVDDAVQNNNLLISSNLPVSAVCDEGMKASNSWTLYFKSFASKDNWKQAADFGAGMKMQANKKPGI